MNRRNHPYFSRGYEPQPQAEQQPSAMNCEHPVVHTPTYVPVLACTGHPMWIENHSDVDLFKQMFEHNMYNPKDGYIVNNNCKIVGNSINPDRRGVISAMVMATDKNGKNANTAFATVVNTEDAGLRYVHCNEDGLIDLGPVEHTCIFGNVARPEGIYVPICNTKAMADAAMYLNNLIKAFTEDDKDLLPPPCIEDSDELPF